MTGMGTFEIQKGHWGAITDVVYLDVGESGLQTRDLESAAIRCRPASPQMRTSIRKAAIWTLAGSYRVIASEASTFDF